jgi:hypothetical protein
MKFGDLMFFVAVAAVDANITSKTLKENICRIKQMSTIVSLANLCRFSKSSWKNADIFFDLSYYFP